MDDFRAILSDPDESDSVKYCILDAIQHGSPLPGLADDLLTMAQNTQLVVYLRREAIQAYHKIAPDNFAKLLALLDDIHLNRVTDDNCDLRGELLKILYPSSLSANKLVEYLASAPLQSSRFDSFSLTKKLIANTSESAIPELIEAIAKARKPAHDCYAWGRFVGQLLVHGLSLLGETIEIEILHQWLTSAFDSHRIPILGREEKQEIRSWLIAHHSHTLNLFEFCISSSPLDRLRQTELHFNEITYNAISEYPSCHKWLFNKAATEPAKERAEFYFINAGLMLYLEHTTDKPTIEELYDFVEKFPQFSECLKNVVISDTTDWRADDAKFKRERKAEAENHRAKNNRIFTSQLDQIKSGNQLGNLNLLARYYQGYYSGADNTLFPYERLVNQTNPDIAAAAMEGFRAVVKRDDLPPPEQISLAQIKRTPYYAGLGIF